MVEALKALLEWLRDFVPARVYQSVLLSLLIATACAEGLALFQGAELREALTDPKILFLVAILSFVCVVIAIREIAVGFRTTTIFVLVVCLMVVAFIAARRCYARRGLTYESLGYYRDASWRVATQKDGDIVLELRVEASKSEPVTFIFEFDLAEQCTKATIGRMYPVMSGQYKVSATQQGEQFDPRHRQWRIEHFQRPAALTFQLEIRDSGLAGQTCVLDHVRKE